MHVTKDDLVLVLSGNEKGKQGKVLKTFPKTNRVLVEGVRLVKRHTRPSSQNQQGGIVEREAPIDVSNVKVVCHVCSKPTRVKHKRLEDGTLVRICQCERAEILDKRG